MKALHEKYVARAREIMKQHQEDGSAPPSDPDAFAVGDKIESSGQALSIYVTPGSEGPGENGATMTPDDKIVARPRGSAAEARSYADQVGALRLDQVYAYIDEIDRLAPTLDFDASILIAQSVHETGDWQSSWWSERLNPAGIGITGDPAQDEASKTFASGVEAARAQLAHMHAYVYGSTRTLPSDLEGTDPRYGAVFEAGNDGSVKTIADLAMKWAIDENYAEGICRRGNAIFDFSKGSGSGSANNPIGQLPAGTDVCVLEGPQSVGDAKWYRVNSNPEGWISGSTLTLVQAKGCSPTEPGPETYAKGDGIEVTQGPKAVKARPGEGFETVYELKTASVMCVLDGHQVVSGVNWYEIRTTGGSVHGWMSQDGTRRRSVGGCTVHPLKTAYDPGDRISVTQTSFDLRSGPGAGYELVGSIARGTHLCVLNEGVTNPSGVWYRVETTDHRYVGWIEDDATQIEVVNGCPEVPASTDPGPYQINDQIDVTEGPLNVRAAAGSGGQIVGSLEAGATLCVTANAVMADGLRWQKIGTGSGSIQGWIATRYTRLVKAGGCATPPPPRAYAVGDHISVSDGPLNVRSGPGLAGSIITALDLGSHMCVLSDPVSANGYTWYQIRTTGGSVTGWVAGDFTRLEAAGACLASPPPFSPHDRATVKAQILEVWSGPASSNDVVYALPTNSWVCVLSGPIHVGTQTWYEVRTTGGSVHGWVLGTGLKLANAGGCVASPPTIWHAGDRISVSDGPLNVRSDPGTIYTVVGSLDTGTHLCVLGGPVSDSEFTWYRIRVHGGTLEGWVAGDFTQMEVVGGCA